MGRTAKIINRIPPPNSQSSETLKVKSIIERLGVMTKYWEPGKVKTRLAESWRQSPDRLNRWVGNPPKPTAIPQEKAFGIASDLHRLFVLYLLERLSTCGDRRELVGSPVHRLPKLGETADPHWRIVDQGDGDLGNRMHRWFLKESTEVELPIDGVEASHSVLIGSDCPLLGPDTIRKAFDQLNDHDLVLGPASDGGYYLIGISARNRVEPINEIFEGISWSTSEVRHQTLRAAERLGWRVSLLETHDDVDTVEDLDRLLVRANSHHEHSSFFDNLAEVIRSSLEVPR